jgi:diketogulonate reductase-like aldo/keto reductase
MTTHRHVTLPGDETVPALGQGTWQMGEDPSRREADIAALQQGIELGMRLIDTAEIYGDGSTETLVGAAIAGRRDEVFLVSKAHPRHAGRISLPEACEASLRRLCTDRIDLYLLHWPGGIPLAETVEAFEALRKSGKIRHWGVSNFDTGDMAALLTEGGGTCATNQILYNLERRGPEYDLLPWLAEHAMPFMAYSPIAQGRLPRGRALPDIARRHDATPFQVALAWVLRRSEAIVIPKAGSIEHVRENHAALDIALTDEDLAALDRDFPPPAGKQALEMI